MSLKKDLHNTTVVKRGFDPQIETGTSALVSAIIDTKGFRATEFILLLGTLSDSDCTTTVLVEEGDNSALTDAAAVADADLLGTEALAAVTFANDQVIRKIGYIGVKRYVRLTPTPAANSGNIPAACCVVQLPNVASVSDQTS